MTLFLEVDGNNFRSHQKKILKDFPNLIPVVKGNGYGFGLNNLVLEVNKLNLDTVCVGTVFEAKQIEKDFKGEILILEPFNTKDSIATKIWQGFNKKFIRTLSSLDSGFDFKSPFVVEGLTSTNRFGIKIKDFDHFEGFNSVNLCGLALHLPIANSKISKVDQVIDWIEKWEQLTNNNNVWLSHVSRAELVTLKKLKPKINFKVRVGTELWLGDKSFLSAKSTVLAVLDDSNRAGYTQKRVPSDKKLLVIAGGTANGIGLNSDKTIKSFKDRLKIIGLSLLAALGKYRSPFLIKGKPSYFFEPAHMNVSLVLVSKAKASVKVGDEVNLNVRFSSTNFDLIKGLN